MRGHKGSEDDRKWEIGVIHRSKCGEKIKRKMEEGRRLSTCENHTLVCSVHRHTGGGGYSVYLMLLIGPLQKPEVIVVMAVCRQNTKGIPGSHLLYTNTPPLLHFLLQSTSNCCDRLRWETRDIQRRDTQYDRQTFRRGQTGELTVQDR